MADIEEYKVQIMDYYRLIEIYKSNKYDNKNDANHINKNQNYTGHSVFNTTST